MERFEVTSQLYIIYFERMRIKISHDASDCYQLKTHNNRVSNTPNTSHCQFFFYHCSLRKYGLTSYFLDRVVLLFEKGSTRMSIVVTDIVIRT